MRILHVNDRPVAGATGGAEIYISRLSEAQRRAGHHVLVFDRPPEHRGARRLLDIWDPVAARRLRRAVADTEPDVVHFHNVIREFSPSVLGATGAVASVATVHDLRAFGGLEHHLPDPRAAVDRVLSGPLVRRELRRNVRMMVAVSEAVRAHLAGYGFRDVFVVRVPVPPPLVAPTPVEECHDVVFVGRLTPDKGLHVLLKAFQEVAERHLEARLVVVGDGPARAEFEARAPQRVLFMGHLDEAGVSAALGRARVVVTPSIPTLRREGSSLVTAEAARHARPVVTSDDPAVAEVASIVDGEILPAGDARALARALDKWLSDGAAAAEAGDRSCVAARDAYNVDTVRRRMDEVYASITSGYRNHPELPSRLTKPEVGLRA